MEHFIVEHWELPGKVSGEATIYHDGYLRIMQGSTQIYLCADAVNELRDLLNKYCELIREYTGKERNAKP